MNNRRSSSSKPTKPSKSEATADDSKAKPKNERPLFFSTSANKVFDADDDFVNKKDKKSLGDVTKFSTAEKLIKEWIITKVTRNDKPRDEPQWVLFWGEQFSTLIKNLGKTIGENYAVGGVLKDKDTTLANYRIDYDPVKSAHYNVLLVSSHEKFYLPIQIKEILNENNYADKSTAESQVITYALEETINALKNDNSLPLEVAKSFIENFEKSDDRKYFQELSIGLRPILKSAISVINTNNKNEITPAQAKSYFIKATHDLFEFCGKEVTRYLLSVEKNPSQKESINFLASRTLVSELEFATESKTNKLAKDIILNQASFFFSNHGINNISVIIVEICKAQGIQRKSNDFINLIRNHMDLSPVKQNEPIVETDSKSENKQENDGDKTPLSNYERSMQLLNILESTARTETASPNESDTERYQSPANSSPKELAQNETPVNSNASSSLESHSTRGDEWRRFHAKHPELSTYPISTQRGLLQEFDAAANPTTSETKKTEGNEEPTNNTNSSTRPGR
jgi:hypothetical protein